MSEQSTGGAKVAPKSPKLEYARIRARKFARSTLEDVTPPFIWKLFIPKTKRKGLPKTFLLNDDNEPFEIGEEGPGALGFANGLPLMRIPVHRLRYYGGLRFRADQQHFVRYLDEGISAMERYYSRHQPTNLFEKHFLSAPERADVPEGGWPWVYHGKTPTGIVHWGEKGLGTAHGAQHYGPVSPQKVALEAGLLDRVKESIKNNGFDPSKGYPSGYFLYENPDRWSFFVKDGQHRVSVMAHLGYDHIVFRPLVHFPLVVSRESCRFWPFVRFKLMSEEEALRIFDTYTAPERDIAIFNGPAPDSDPTPAVKPPAA